MQSVSLKEAELTCRRLELEAKESAERAARAEAERDAARHEAMMAKLQIEWVVNTRAQVESELTRVQRALAVMENTRLKAKSERGVAQEALAVGREACSKAEEENSRLADERLALVMEFGTIKDDFAAFQEEAVTNRETMEAELDASDDTLFNYIWLWMLRFYAQHMWEQASDPGWNARSFSPVNSRVLCQPSLPPKHLVSHSSPKSSCC